MATTAQIERMLAELEGIHPVAFFRRMDETQAGIGAVLRLLHTSEEEITAGKISEVLNISTARVAVLIRKMAANIPKARQDYNELKTVYDAELAQINERTAPLKAQLQQMEGSIDPDLMRRYKSARAAGANPIVPLSGNRCNGCNMEIPSASAKRIREDGVILECENCGRLLYAPKD